MVRKAIVSTMSIYLTNALNAGNPILEDDGRLMWFMNCGWESYPGVPYVPEN